ncbi:hypothetical protein Baya_7621 [Bagarius yarrelli]|uniref:Uncharacterized protein n=1 Tax=Bagarius yarrelli TaxID=175774 RepID=A0A556U297_BAGYA|nr:hypothetical protein Baya_7621 [Bagarius yarrelli]
MEWFRQCLLICTIRDGAFDTVQLMKQLLWENGAETQRMLLLCGSVSHLTSLNGENITLETVMGFLKSRPPDILKPQGDGPVKFTVKAMIRVQDAGQHLTGLCSQNMKKKKEQ